jgi:HK97 family phage major capsid protein
VFAAESKSLSIKGIKLSEFIKTQAEVRANLIAQMRDVLDTAEAEKRGLTAEDTQKIERIEADIEQRDAAIATAQKVAEREARAAEAAGSFVPAAEAKNADADLLRSIARGEVRGHEFARENRAALVPSSNTVGQSFYDQVFGVARLIGPMLNTSEVINTASGETLVLPTVTAYSTASATSAGSAITESNATFSSLSLGAFKIGALVSISNELIADAGFDIAAYIAQQLGESLGYQANSLLTVGTGTVQPNGLANSAGSVVTGGTGVSGAFTYENLIDLAYGIADGARVLPNLGFQMSKTGIATARKLKDSVGNYIWTNSAVPGQPATLLGYNVYENPAVAAVATGAKSVLFGHLPSYKVRIAGGLQIAQSADYAFNSDVTTFRGTLRLDGGLTHATHVGYFKGAAS